MDCKKNTTEHTMTATVSITAEGDGDGNNHPHMTWLNLIHQIIDQINSCWPTCHPGLLFSLRSPHIFRVTGTIICPINDKVRLCIQEHSRSFPILLIDLPITTLEFASLIRRGGTGRIVLKSDCDSGESSKPLVLSVTQWVMYCNRQMMGFATRREVTGKDTWLLEMLRTVTVGAGVLPEMESGSGGYKYLRGQFERAVGSDYSETYHLMDPSGSLGQELSIFFLRN